MIRKVTALKNQKRNLQRTNVYLDGEFAFGLSNATAARLEVGQEINEEDISVLQMDENYEIAYQKAIKLISYRPRSEKEVQLNLSKHGIPLTIIETTIDRLRTNGLIDDEVFARQWTENRNYFRPRSRKVLFNELKQKGISTEIIDQTLNDFDDNELAYIAGKKQSLKLTHLGRSEFNSKLGSYLLRRGFTFDIITSTLAKIWDEYHSTFSQEKTN
jgi:regulatory protein